MIQNIKTESFILNALIHSFWKGKNIDTKFNCKNFEKSNLIHQNICVKYSMELKKKNLKEGRLPILQARIGLKKKIKEKTKKQSF